MTIQEILIIKNASESYGISTECINQISRVPAITKLPLRPKGIRGLCAVNGNIVTLLDLNLLLDISEVDLKNDDSRLLSLNDELSSSALLVSKVYNTLNIDDSNIEYIDNKGDPVIAIYKHKDSLIQILSLETIISNISKIDIKSKEIKNGKIKEPEIKEEDLRKFLIFAMSNEKFALNIDYLREIILADIDFTDIAGSSDDLLGLITLRNDILAVIDLRSYYGFSSKRSDSNRILITSYNDERIGLLVDDIIDIKSVLNSDVEYMRDSFEDNKISGVIHDKNSLIPFFDEDVLKVIFSKNSSYIDSKSKIISHINSSEIAQEVIIFKLLGKEYAFDVEYVAEIIDIVDSIKVAYSDENIDGIINIRGQIVTIVSLYKKLSIPRKRNEDSKIIICDIDENKIGFVVDSISDILYINSDEQKNQDEEIFKHVLHLEGGKRLVLSMDIKKIISSKEK
ncbi:chemotaxis protein CheW [Sulfurimonas sp.]|uniref:chemotaxis protein CheW n=1 Tax=Sulfurimonas sp. TaxID=2022749 RepID=UPI002B494193|nr:chemotaxis protein CheW [Sulfurimonas sp.]